MKAIRRFPRTIVFLLATLWLFLIETRFANDALEHLYFHPWTSEYMMQTVSVGDLRAEPLKSLWYNHIQPPAFDAIRAAIAVSYPSANAETLMRRVDLWLYRVWLVLYGASAVLVFSWIRRAWSDRAAWFALPVYLFLPGPVFYATFLDSTFLSAVLILWFFAALWRLASGDSVSGELATVCILLFLTRSVFQWPFLVILAASLWLLRVPRVRAARILVPVAVFMALFLTKQYVLFGLTITSSFGPDNFCKGISVHCHGTAKVDLPKTVDRYRAFVLRRAAKLNGEYNYNQEAFLHRSFSQMAEYRAHLRRMTPGRAIEIVRTNLDFYLRPTTRYSSHLIVDRLPWRRLFDVVLSGFAVVVLVAVAALAWWRAVSRQPVDERARTIRAGIALALPALYIAAVTILFESGENMRFRFFLEPVCFVLLVITVRTILSLAESRQAARLPVEPAVAP